MGLEGSEQQKKGTLFNKDRYKAMNKYVFLALVLFYGCATNNKKQTQDTDAEQAVVTGYGADKQIVDYYAEKKVIGWGLTEHSPREGSSYKKLFDSLNPKKLIDNEILLQFGIGSIEHYNAVKDLIALSSAEEITRVDKFLGITRIDKYLLDSLLSWRLAVFYPYSDDEQSILKTEPCIYDYKSDFGFVLAEVIAYAYMFAVRFPDKKINICFDTAFIKISF